LARLTGRFGIEPVLAAAAFAGAVLFVPFALVEYVPALFALAFGIGLALGVSQPLTLNLVYNHSPPGRSGEATGLRLTINNVTHVGVPIAAGSLAAVLGVAPVFWTSAALLTIAGYLTRKT
jgi:MFS family permease